MLKNCTIHKQTLPSYYVYFKSMVFYDRKHFEGGVNQLSHIFRTCIVKGWFNFHMKILTCFIILINVYAVSFLLSMFVLFRKISKSGVTARIPITCPT